MRAALTTPARKYKTNNGSRYQNNQHVGSERGDTEAIAPRKPAETSENYREADHLEHVAIIRSAGAEVSCKVQQDAEEDGEGKSSDETPPREGSVLEWIRHTLAANAAP